MRIIIEDGDERTVLDIPEKSAEIIRKRHNYFMAGVDPFAYRIRGQPWKIKHEWCNLCGLCCMDCGVWFFETITLEDGKERCVHLEEEPGTYPEPPHTRYRCSLQGGRGRPFGCCVHYPYPQHVEECEVRYKDVE
jgi:hypothetical protein